MNIGQEYKAQRNAAISSDVHRAIKRGLARIGRLKTQERVASEVLLEEVLRALDDHLR